MRRVTAVLAFALLVLHPSGLAADQRQDPMDIIIALDKSLSMEEEIGAVKEYVASAIVDGLVIPGDLLVVIGFYGKTDVVVSTIVADAASKESINNAISSVRADGRWTDIGSALDELRRQLEATGRQGIPKHLLLITDGKPEPPPDSKYWSPDGSFNHEFLDNTRIIQKEGWKVQVLGLGSAADARELAEKLSGIYTEVSSEPTVEELTEKTREFLGSMAVEGQPRMSAIGRRGSGTIGLTVKSAGYDGPKTVVLSGIRLSLAEETRENVLTQKQSMEIPAAGRTDVSIPITVMPPLEPGWYSGTFDFSYDGTEQITPTVLTVDFRVNSVLRNNLGFVLGGAALVVAGLVALALLLTRRPSGGRLSFRLVVAEAVLPEGKDVYTLAPGASLYLEEDAGAISLTEGKTDRSAARLYVRTEEGTAPALAMEILKPKSFLHAEEVPPSLFGAELVMKAERARKLHLRFEAAGPDA